MGELGYSKAGIIFIDEPTHNQGTIKIDNRCVDLVKASFTLIESINKNQAIVRCKGVSGTIAGSKRFLS